MAFWTNLGNHAADNHIAALIIMVSAGFYVYEKSEDCLFYLPDTEKGLLSAKKIGSLQT